MAKISTVLLHHPDGGQIRVNEDRVEEWKQKGWREKSGPRGNLKAVKKGGKSADPASSDDYAAARDD